MLKTFIIFTILSLITYQNKGLYAVTKNTTGIYHIVTKSLEGLPAFKKSNHMYGIKSMKAIILRPGTILNVLPPQIHRRKGYSLVMDNQTKKKYFISTKWLERGIPLNKNARTFNFENILKIPKEVTRILSSPAPECIEGEPNHTTSNASRYPANYSDDEKKLISEGMRDGKGKDYKELFYKIRRMREKADYGDSDVDKCYEMIDEHNNKLENRVWENIADYDEDKTLRERTSRIYAHAKIAFREIKKSAQKAHTIRRSSSSVRRNPHIISDQLGPEIAACIAYIEDDHLRPNVVTKALCRKKGITKYIKNDKNHTEKSYIMSRPSTANGVGQQTKTTFLNLRSEKALPITTRGNLYDGLSDIDLFFAMNDDVSMQMEVVLRYFNYELKHPDRSKKPIVAIYQSMSSYDSDREAIYLKKFRACFRCFKKEEGKRNPSLCYQSASNSAKWKDEGLVLNEEREEDEKLEEIKNNRAKKK